MRTWIAIAANLLLLGVVLGGLAVPAQAEDASPSALSRLTTEERTHLASKIPGWETLPPERQERIARNFLRVRDLPPEERARLARRIERLEGERRAGRGPSPHRHRRGPPDEGHRRRLRQRFLLMRAVGAALWADLPAETRRTIADAVGENGRRAVEMAFYRRLWDHVARSRAAAGVPSVELPEDAPAAFRRRVEEARRRAAAGDGAARMRLAYMAIGQESHAFLTDLEASAKADPKALTEVAAVLTERHPEAFQKARAELTRVAADPTALARYVRRGQGGREGRRTPGPGGMAEERGRALLRALESARPYLERYPALARQAGELREGLRRALGARPGARPPGARPPGGRRRHPGIPGPGRPGRPEEPKDGEEK